MKKIILLSTLALLAVVLSSACITTGTVPDVISPLIDKGRSALTASAFTIIAGYKSLLNTLKK